nr:MAG TPA: CHAP domain protein [Caudoviricetes sp.]
MSMTASKALAWAASQIGYTRWDDPEEGSLYGRWYAKKHGTYYGTSGVPFCAMFASWCLTDDDGASVIPGGDFAYVPYAINAARAAGQLVAPSNAAPGDLICFDWDGDGVADHVGLVEANYGSWVQTIEGNTSSGAAGSQSNGGGVWRRTRDWDSVCAVIRPSYGDAATASGYTDVTALQAAVGATADNIVGPDTTKRIYAVVAASSWGGRQFPFGIEYVQSVIGTEADGVWGDASDEAHDRVVGNLQRAVGVADDEIYGPTTNNAINAALAGAEKGE